ncbi:class I histocompatibility antigen, F10 alpha chain-like [Engraulis encrasicolus]|uniref:class I histocompatibility antigen, F10 alpha chain-like n=1 Tax=Engraulis encrasicolus TaxID=184585 RepID=UPI002FD78E50
MAIFHFSKILKNDIIFFSGTHSLQYLYTASSGIPDLPEYISVGEVDGLVISYYDSSIGKEVPKQDWMAENLDEQYWTNETKLGLFNQEIFKENINILKQRFDQTEGAAVFQKTYGCQWDDETNVTDAFEAFGYNGEDFMSLDPKTMTWTSPIPQAANTVYKWNRMESYMPHRKAYFQKDCVDWLKKYVNFTGNHMGKETEQQDIRPQVSLISHQRAPKHFDVVCLATGFYPKEVNITWKKDGEEMMQGDVNISATLPNGDGTFQKRCVLTISPEERKTHQYSCEVQHNNGEPIVVFYKDGERGDFSGE